MIIFFLLFNNQSYLNLIIVKNGFNSTEFKTKSQKDHI